MYPKGHMGVSLLLYAPIGFFLSVTGQIPFAILGFLMVGAFATIPDKDMNAPLLSHRGRSHSIASALLFGVVLAFIAVFLAPLMLTLGLPAVPIIVFVFFIGAFTVMTHLAGDALTPTGVRMFWPISNRRISLGFFLASSTIANWVLWLFGWFMILMTFLLVMGTLFG